MLDVIFGLTLVATFVCYVLFLFIYWAETTAVWDPLPTLAALSTTYPAFGAQIVFSCIFSLVLLLFFGGRIFAMLKWFNHIKPKVLTGDVHPSSSYLFMFLGGAQFVIVLLYSVANVGWAGWLSFETKLVRETLWFIQVSLLSLLVLTFSFQDALMVRGRGVALGLTAAISGIVRMILFFLLLCDLVLMAVAYHSRNEGSGDPNATLWGEKAATITAILEYIYLGLVFSFLVTVVPEGIVRFFYVRRFEADAKTKALPLAAVSVPSSQVEAAPGVATEAPPARQVSEDPKEPVVPKTRGNAGDSARARVRRYEVPPDDSIDDEEMEMTNFLHSPILSQKAPAVIDDPVVVAPPHKHKDDSQEQAYGLYDPEDYTSTHFCGGDCPFPRLLNGGPCREEFDDNEEYAYAVHLMDDHGLTVGELPIGSLAVLRQSVVQASAIEG